VSGSSLADIAHRLVGGGKGLLAMDESTATCNRRFEAVGIAQTEAARLAYRDLLITAPGLGAYISGVILYDETIRQVRTDGSSFVACLDANGILPGIKVDIGTTALAGHRGEKVTEGLDGLRARLAGYAAMGARFAKWRAVIGIGEQIPSRGGISANAAALARYAGLCQEAGIVPVVEPEVLMAGDHSLARCGEVTEAVLYAVFSALHEQGVMLEGMILKPNMVLAGLEWPHAHAPEEIAAATLACLRRIVPAAVAGIAFLSGGQSGVQASARLNALNQGDAPWPLVFSFARALQQPALQVWRGEAANRAAAQQALLHRARCNHAAIQGCYTPSMEALEVAA
jgi:fructose-bisphosphate aldolase class I